MEDARFNAVLDKIKALHELKMEDYGQDDDHYANVRSAEQFGVEPWIGCMVRANDKMRRLMKAAKGGKLANESVQDSMEDLAVYSIIALLLYEEMLDKEDQMGFVIEVPAGADVKEVWKDGRIVYTPI